MVHGGPHTNFSTLEIAYYLFLWDILCDKIVSEVWFDLSQHQNKFSIRASTVRVDDFINGRDYHILYIHYNKHPSHSFIFNDCLL